MVSSRDRSDVSVQTTCSVKEQVRRQNTAACVSLSNSTMSKTVAASAAPPVFAGGARSGVSIDPPFPCQPSFSAPLAPPRKPGLRHEEDRSGARGRPLPNRFDSVEGAEYIASLEKVKDQNVAVPTFPPAEAAVPREGAI